MIDLDVVEISETEFRIPIGFDDHLNSCTMSDMLVTAKRVFEMDVTPSDLHVSLCKDDPESFVVVTYVDASDASEICIMALKDESHESFLEAVKAPGQFLPGLAGMAAAVGALSITDLKGENLVDYAAFVLCEELVENNDPHAQLPGQHQAQWRNYKPVARTFLDVLGTYEPVDAHPHEPSVESLAMFLCMELAKDSDPEAKLSGEQHCQWRNYTDAARRLMRKLKISSLTLPQMAQLIGVQEEFPELMPSADPASVVKL